MDEQVISEWKSFIGERDFPCVAAKAALARSQQHYFVGDHLACPKDDAAILSFIYEFVEAYRASDSLFHSAVVLFREPEVLSEEVYDRLFWQKLQALSDLDAQNFPYDPRVAPSPDSENFSFSLHSEAFFVIGLHPASSRVARRFTRPAIVFNPHAQFEELRNNGQYEKMKNIIRRRDVALEGSINPMLTDFGTASEVYQYTGRRLPQNWQCPLQIHHNNNEHNKSA